MCSRRYDLIQGIMGKHDDHLGAVAEIPIVCDECGRANGHFKTCSAFDASEGEEAIER